jgi:hypothetical protein
MPIDLILVVNLVAKSVFFFFSKIRICFFFKKKIKIYLFLNFLLVEHIALSICILVSAFMNHGG